MMKKFFITLLILVLAAAGYGYVEFYPRKILITPYPYSFNDNAKNALQSELKEAESTKILIVGDRMGESLSKYTPEMLADLAKNFKNPPKIYNWSKPHEGLHRTLYKLKSLKKIPSIVIYLGASSELFEKTFEASDKNIIFKNFSLYDDEKIISLIITFPWLSKIIYKRMHYFELGALKEYHDREAAQARMDEKEISFKLFDYELREMIEVLKDKKSNLILITTPLNLEVLPKDICAHSTSNGVIELQQEIEEAIKNGDYKNAYPKALSLSQETYSNAQSFFLLGKSALGLGNLKDAREALQKATVFDCSNWRGNAVYNAIIKGEAGKHQVLLIDFDQYMTSSLSKDGLFIDEIFPQNIFYQNMMQELKELLKKVMSVNE